MVCHSFTMIRDKAKDIAGQSRLEHSCRSGFPAAFQPDIPDVRLESLTYEWHCF